ncbi:MAG: DUF11 domain-containing protein, partial [bacterium]|nr:DUF11 domain-containing protein [bacterium]
MAAAEAETAIERPELRAETSYSHTLFLPLLAQNASPSAAVMLEKWVRPSLALAGDVVTYTMVVSNTGGLLLRNGVLVDHVPEQIEILAASGAEYNTGADELRWEVEPLSPGQKVTVTVQAQVSEGITTSVVESGAVFSAEAQATAAATATLMIGQAVTGTFTPEGGQVLSFDERIRVVAPAGAVTQTTVVTMVSAPVRELGLPGQRGVHFSLSPDMHFAVSVTMIVSLTSCPESIY